MWSQVNLVGVSSLRVQNALEGVERMWLIMFCCDRVAIQWLLWVLRPWLQAAHQSFQHGEPEHNGLHRQDQDTAVWEFTHVASCTRCTDAWLVLLALILNECFCLLHMVGLAVTRQIVEHITLARRGNWLCPKKVVHQIPDDNFVNS